MKVGRNDPCPCGSGKKYKKCCLGKGDDAEAQAARERAEALRAVTPLVPELSPRGPEGEARDKLWGEFEAAEPAELPALFRRALAQELLDDDFVYELLATLRDSDERPMADTLLSELRAARPDIYRLSAPYYLEWQIADALAEGRDDKLPDLASALAETAGDDLDMFYASRDRLAYHGKLALVVAMMRQAWPLVRASNKYIPGADDEFAANGQQLTMLAYVERTAEPRADDHALLAALEIFGPVDPARLAEQLALLTGQEDRPWERTDRSEDEQINRLGLRFQGELARTWGMPLSRGEMGRVTLVNYIARRRDDHEQPAARPQKAKGAPQPAPAGPKAAADLLCPDRASLDHYVAQLLGPISMRFYDAAVTLELTPAWLHFLESQDLITAERRAATLADLRRLMAESAPIWDRHKSDLAVANNLRAAWDRAEAG